MVLQKQASLQNGVAETDKFAEKVLQKQVSLQNNGVETDKVENGKRGAQMRTKDVQKIIPQGQGEISVKV